MRATRWAQPLHRQSPPRNNLGPINGERGNIVRGLEIILYGGFWRTHSKGVPLCMSLVVGVQALTTLKLIR